MMAWRHVSFSARARCRYLVLGGLDDLRRRVQWPRDAAWLLRCKGLGAAHRQRGDGEAHCCWISTDSIYADKWRDACGSGAAVRLVLRAKLRRAAAFQANPLTGWVRRARRQPSEATAIHRHAYRNSPPPAARMLEPKALKSFTFGVPRKGKKGQPPGQRGSPPSLDDGRQARRDAARHQMLGGNL